MFQLINTKRILIIVAFVAASTLAVMAPTVSATTPDDPVEQAPTSVPNDCNATGGNINQGNCGIIRYLVMFINILSALVGIVVVGSIIYGGIQYSMAGSDPSKIGEAKNRIRNALIALLFFIFGYSFLNYLVPGGVL